MKFLAIVSIVSCTLAAAGIAIPAAAQAYYPGFRPYIQAPGQGQGKDEGAAPRRGADRPMPQRDMRGSDETDRGRMSTDERRQLRRDIQDAGKDIYRPAPQGRGDGRRSGRR